MTASLCSDTSPAPSNMAVPLQTLPGIRSSASHPCAGCGRTAGMEGEPCSGVTQSLIKEQRRTGGAEGAKEECLQLWRRLQREPLPCAKRGTPRQRTWGFSLNHTHCLCHFGIHQGVFSSRVGLISHYVMHRPCRRRRRCRRRRFPSHGLGGGQRRLPRPGSPHPSFTQRTTYWWFEIHPTFSTGRGRPREL